MIFSDLSSSILSSKKVATNFIKNMKRPGGDNITLQQIDIVKNETENRPKNLLRKIKKSNKKSLMINNSKSNSDKKNNI